MGRLLPAESSQMRFGIGSTWDRARAAGSTASVGVTRGGMKGWTSSGPYRVSRSEILARRVSGRSGTNFHSIQNYSQHKNRSAVALFCPGPEYLQGRRFSIPLVTLVPHHST